VHGIQGNVLIRRPARCRRTPRPALQIINQLKVISGMNVSLTTSVNNGALRVPGKDLSRVEGIAATEFHKGVPREHAHRAVTVAYVTCTSRFHFVICNIHIALLPCHGSHTHRAATCPGPAEAAVTSESASCRSPHPGQQAGVRWASPRGAPRSLPAAPWETWALGWMTRPGRFCVRRKL
jgi:hypothetical protein